MTSLILKCVGLVAASGLATVANLPAPQATPEEPSIDVSGNYYYGDGLGANMRLDLEKDNTFKFVWTGCMGVYGKCEGSYRVQNGLVTLKPSTTQEKEFGSTKTRFYPVKWADRLYLVADDEMLEFASKYGMGWRGVHYDGRSGSHYLRNGISNFLTQPVEGKPDVPAPFRRYLTRPFQADITAVKGREITIDQGSSAGLYPGTSLRLRERRTIWLRVKKTSAESAVCVLDEKASVKSGERVMIAVYGFF